MVTIDGLDFLKYIDAFVICSSCLAVQLFKIEMSEQKSLDRKTTINDVLQFHTLWVKLRLHKYFRDNACFQELTGLYLRNKCALFQEGVVGVLTIHN